MIRKHSSLVVFLVVFLAAVSHARQGAARAPQDAIEQDTEFKKRIAAIEEDLEELGEGKDAKRKRLDEERVLCERGRTLIERMRKLAAGRFATNEAMPDKGERAAHTLPADFALPVADFAYFDLLRHRAAIDALQKKLTQSLAELEKAEVEAKSRSKSIQDELAYSRGRTNALIDSERKEAQAALTRVKELLASVPPPEPDQYRLLALEQEVHELQLAVLASEQSGKARWREWLGQQKQNFATFLERLENDELAPLRKMLGAVEQRLAQVRAFNLPLVPEFQDPSYSPEVLRAVRQVFLDSRQRTASIITEIAAGLEQRLELTARLKKVEKFRDASEAKVNEYLENTKKGAQTEAVQYFKLRSARLVLDRFLTNAAADPNWDLLPRRKRELRQQLKGALDRLEDIDGKIKKQLLRALAGGASSGATDVPDEFQEERMRWVNKERDQASSLLSGTETNAILVTKIEDTLLEQRRILVNGLKELQRRGLLLRDPERLTASGLLDIPSTVKEQATQISERLFGLPSRILDASARHSAGSAYLGMRLVLALLLLLGGFILYFYFNVLGRRTLEEIDAQEETPERLVHLLAVFGWIRRIAIPLGIGAFFLVSAAFFLQEHEDARLCMALGRVFILTSLWSAAARVCLRPSRPELRILKLDDKNARWLHRATSVGLAFWVLGLVAGILGAVLTGSEGRSVESNLAGIRDGVLLLLLFSFFMKRRLLLQLFRTAEEGGIQFLQAFVLLLLWPARLSLAAAFVLWVLSYHALAVFMGMIVVASLGSIIAGIIFHQTLRNEVYHRFVEPSGEPGVEGKHLSLLGDYLRIPEFLASLCAAVLSFSWILGLDYQDWMSFWQIHLWGDGGAGSGPGKPDRSVRVGGILLLFLTIYLTVALAKRSRRTIGDFLENRTKFDRGLRYTLGTLSGYLIFTVGVVFALNFIHLDLDKLGWMMAAMSVGIGFGLRDIISNFFSGLILLFERPLRVGDIIKVGDVLGEVKRIKIRSTVVTSFDNIDIIVPNKDFITSEITNWTSSDRDMRSTLGVGVNYGADLEKVREVLLETVSKHGRVYKDPAPVIYISSFGDSSIDFAVVYWTLLDFKRGTFSDLHFAIDAAFKREGIEIPFPQRDINFKVEEMPVFLTAPKDELLEATAGPKKEKDPDSAEPGSDEGDRGSGGGDEDL